MCILILFICVGLLRGAPVDNMIILRGSTKEPLAALNFINTEISSPETGNKFMNFRPTDSKILGTSLKYTFHSYFFYYYSKFCVSSASTIDRDHQYHDGLELLHQPA